MRATPGPAPARPSSGDADSKASRLSWLAMAVVLAVALGIGAGGDGTPRTEGARVAAIAREVRCPTCRGLSVAESDAKAAQAIRAEIATRVRAGETDDEVRAFLVSRYTREILLTPDSGGVAGLVWALPVAGLVCALAGLAFAFRRWRARSADPLSAEDEALVARALSDGGGER